MRDGKYHVITYDQDSSLSGSAFLSEPLANIWNFSQGEADGLFLPTIFEDSDAKEFYNTLLTAFVEQFYRSDKEGLLYERMRILSKFMTKYNPGREGLSARLRSQANSMVQNSEKVQQDLGLTGLPPATHHEYDACGESIVSQL